MKLAESFPPLHIFFLINISISKNIRSGGRGLSAQKNIKNPDIIFFNILYTLTNRYSFKLAFPKLMFPKFLQYNILVIFLRIHAIYVLLTGKTLETTRPLGGGGGVVFNPSHSPLAFRTAPIMSSLEMWLNKFHVKYVSPFYCTFKNDCLLQCASSLIQICQKDNITDKIARVNWI